MKDFSQKFLDGENTAIWFSSPSRSVHVVSSRFNLSFRDSQHRIASGLIRLAEDGFCNTELQRGIVVDIYCLENFYSENWYVKFSICRSESELPYLEEVSFHPLEKNIKLANGRTVSKSTK